MKQDGTISFELLGTPAALKALRHLATIAPQVCGRALHEEAEKIMADSKENYTPVLDGYLRNSGTVLKPDLSGGSVSVTLGYGGLAKDYALTIHENERAGKTGGVSPTGTAYKRWAKVGEWKYLETPMKKAVGGMARRVLARVRQLLGR